MRASAWMCGGNRAQLPCTRYCLRSAFGARAVFAYVRTHVFAADSRESVCVGRYVYARARRRRTSQRGRVVDGNGGQLGPAANLPHARSAALASGGGARPRQLSASSVLL
eukprot:2838106-Pleurochrysis_carterae.AAC.1